MSENEQPHSGGPQTLLSQSAQPGGGGAGGAGGSAGIVLAGEQRKVTYVSVSQDYSCFAIGTTLGFYVYTCDPLAERFRREWGKGVGIVEPLENSNILAIVGGGPSPKWPRNKLIIWDDYQNRVTHTHTHIKTTTCYNHKKELYSLYFCLILFYFIFFF